MGKRGIDSPPYVGRHVRVAPAMFNITAISLTNEKHIKYGLLSIEVPGRDFNGSSCSSDFQDLLVENPAPLPPELLITVNMFINLETSPSRVIGEVKNGKHNAIGWGTVLHSVRAYFKKEGPDQNDSAKEDMRKDWWGLCISPQPPESLSAFQPPP